MKIGIVWAGKVCREVGDASGRQPVVSIRPTGAPAGGDWDDVIARVRTVLLDCVERARRSGVPDHAPSMLDRATSRRSS
jgi:hypothetical protein